MGNIYVIGNRVFFSSSWGVMLLRGIVLILLGIAFIRNTALTVTVCIQILGALLIISGVVGLIMAGSKRTPAVRNMATAGAIITIAIGILMYIFAPMGVFILMLIVAFISLFTGFRLIQMAGKMRGSSGLMWIAGLIAIAVAVLITVSYNEIMTACGWILGLYLVGIGIFTVTLAGGMRQKRVR